MSTPFDRQDALRVALESFKATRPFSAAFLSGSVVEGLATPKSDYDVYVVGASAYEGEELFLTLDDGALIEVTILSEDYIVGIANRLKEGYLSGNEISPYQRILLHRIVTGEPLTNAPEVLRLKALVDIEAFKRYLVDAHAYAAQKCIWDGVGNLDAGDQNSALFNIDRAVHKSLDAIVAHNGSTSTVVKWRTRYAERYLGRQHPAFIRYMELTGSIPTTLSAPAKVQYFASAARYVQCVSDYIHSMHRFPDVTFEFNECRLWGAGVAIEPQRIQKHPIARIVERDGKLFLVDRVTRYQVTNDVLAVWLCLDNVSTADDVISTLSTKPWSVSDDPRKLVLKCLENFRRLGVVY